MPKIILLILLCSLVPVQDERLRRGVRESHGLAELPIHVRAPDQELTLFADYGDIRGDNIVLYLVNRTSEPVRLEAQDSDIYVKLEFKNDDEEWVRAQAHRYSWCGNSYMNPPLLEADRFFKFLGYHPSEGDRRPVRYRRYAGKLDLVSNEGFGQVDWDVVEAAALDPMAIRTGSLAFVSRVALGELEIPQPDPRRTTTNPRVRAVATLAQERFKPEDVIPVLEKLRNDEKEKVARQARSALAKVMKRQKRLRAKTSP